VPTKAGALKVFDKPLGDESRTYLARVAYALGALELQREAEGNCEIDGICWG
jgi:hypothetical protein